MAAAVFDQVVVEHGDAANVRADLFVVPSTTQGSFGQPWRSIVAPLGVSGQQGPIALGDVALYDLAEGAPVRYLGFAATLEGAGPTTPDVVSSIGRRLGELTVQRGSILDIATPSLGTGVGRLDPTLSLQALVQGFVSTASPSARLRIIEVDRAKLVVLTKALAALKAPADTEVTGQGVPDWKDLTASAKGALSLAEAYRRSAKSSKIHMEQLVAALFMAAEPPVRALFGGVDAHEIVTMAASVGKTEIPEDASPIRIRSLPSLSRHVEDAMVAARGRAGADRPVTDAHLVGGALATNCSFIRTLLEKVRGRGAVLADPAADTVPDQDVGASDRLNLGREVEMLATVALAKETPLPLAIGLFGEWGSGKSFFMAMLHERMDALSRLAKEGKPEAAPFCRHIRQVHFNAWHYVDGNLWASLAATIFDGLVDDPDDDVKRSRADRLGEATQAELEAKAAVRKAEQELRDAQQRAARPMAIARSAIPSAIEAVRDVPDLEKQLRNFEDPEGVEAPAERLVGAVEAASKLGRETEVFRRLVRVELAQRRRRATLIWLATVVLVVVAVVALGQLDLWGAILTTVIGLLSVLTPAVAGATRILRLARTARTKREEPVVAAEQELARARRDEELATEQRNAREEELARLRNRGQRLHDLVRSARSEYGAQLSMMSQLRKDFEQLTWLLQNDDVGPENTPAPDGAPPEELRAAAARVCKEGSGSPGDSLEVERIVLYVDDLDRCPAKDVVRVLQAINLLLTFKLFVVVIGVDGRWLESSLKARYDKLLEQPRDYLEKIIQLPFVLRPMTTDGYTAMIDALTPDPAPREEPDTATGDAVEAGRYGDEKATRVPPHGPAVVDTPVLEKPDVEVAPATEGALADNGVARPRPESLVISEDERKLLGQLGAVITTPRTAKRLVNTYRMLRVCAGEDDPNHFSPAGDREYQAVITLLAVLIGCPNEADAVFDRIMTSDPSDDVWHVLEAHDDKGSAVEVPVSVLKPLVEVSSIEAYQRWVPLVSRFTYRLGSVVDPTPTSV